jgi:peroxiredoxin
MKRLLLLALVFLTGCYSSTRPQHIGSHAADFTLQDSERKVTLSQYRGQIVVLNFWATWCPPCVEETPSMVAMQQQMKDKGVTVLAVSIDVDQNAYDRFLRQYRVNYLTVRDPERKVSDVYGTFGWPETYIIDQKGIIRRKFIGAVDWTSPEIVQFLTTLSNRPA